LFAWGYFAGVPRDDQIRLARRGELAFLAGSTDGDLFMAGVAPALARKSEFLADRESSFAADVQCWPELADLLAGAERDGPLRIVSSWHGYFRPAAGPGWALLGDAGQFKDPTPGQGISDALRHAQRLTEVIAATHAEPAALDDGLRRWWRWRDRDSREMHWFASDLGAPGPTPALRASMIGDLASTPAGTRSFLHLINHDIPPSRVFTPKRLARAVIAVRRARQVPVRDIAREALSLVAGDVRHARLGAPKPAGVRSSRRRAARPGSASETVAATPARR
jgi:2-polyprenyl-6-methoxyphenol hydroxylase-like FAD-dependent oxidoreductase